jgi:hypothetical protein
MRIILTAVFAASLAASPATAAFTTVNVPTNGLWSSQSFFNIPTGNVTLGGVNFFIASSQGTDAAYWTAAGNAPGPVELTLSVNIEDAKNAYSLLNTFWGAAAPNVGSVTFKGANGLTQTFSLAGNSDVRDYFQNVYTNEINGTTTVQVFANGARRLDMQKFALAAGFQDENLTSIVFTDLGSDGYSRLTLTGVTVETGAVNAVPEPATWAMMLGGFGLLGASVRRRTRSSVTYA